MLILNGHKGKVHTLAFSPDGTMLATVSGRSSTVNLWDLSRGEVVRHVEHDRRVVHVAFAPGQRPIVAYADSAGNVTLCDTASGRKCRVERVAPAANQQTRLAFSPTGRFLAVTGQEPRPEVHGLLSPYTRPQHLVCLFERGSGISADLLYYCRHTGRYLSAVAFSPDGRTVVAGSVDGTLSLWPLTAHSLPMVLDLRNAIHFVACAPDGRTVLAASMRGLIKVWDARTGQKKTTLKGQINWLHAVAYSPDGRKVASASGDGRVRMWNVETGQPCGAFDWQIGELHSVAFAPDGMRAAAGGDGEIVIWDIDGW